MHLVVFGHSHVWSVRRALADHWAHSGVTAEVPVCGTKELPGPVMARSTGPGGVEKPTLNPVIVALLNRVLASQGLAETWMISMVQGNFYNQIGMVAQDRAFDFVLDTHPDLPLTPGATLLPCDAVRLILTRQMAEFQSYAPILAKTALRDRMILVGPPPPPRSPDQIAALLAAGPKAGAQAEADAAPETVVITPAITRLKLWHMQNQIAQGYCVAAGLRYLRGDLPGTQDADGFILPAFTKDAVHANHIYSDQLLHCAADIATGQKGLSHG